MPRIQNKSTYESVHVEATGFAIVDGEGTLSLTGPQLELVPSFYDQGLTVKETTPTLIESLECICQMNALGLEPETLEDLAETIAEYKAEPHPRVLGYVIDILYNEDVKAPALLINWVDGLAMANKFPFRGYSLPSLQAVVSRVLAQMLLQIKVPYQSQADEMTSKPDQYPTWTAIWLEIAELELGSLQSPVTDSAVQLKRLVDVADASAKVEGIVTFYRYTSKAIVDFNAQANSDPDLLATVEAFKKATASMSITAPL